jgi:hypothetical protein
MDILKKVQNAEFEAIKQAAVQQAAVRVAYNDFLQRHAMESHQKVFDRSTLDAIAQMSKTHGGGTRQPGRSETNPLVRPKQRRQPQWQRRKQEQAGPVAESEGYFHGQPRSEPSFTDEFGSEDGAQEVEQSVETSLRTWLELGGLEPKDKAQQNAATTTTLPIPGPGSVCNLHDLTVETRRRHHTRAPCTNVVISSLEFVVRM